MTRFIEVVNGCCILWTKKCDGWKGKFVDGRREYKNAPVLLHDSAERILKEN